MRQRSRADYFAGVSSKLDLRGPTLPICGMKDNRRAVSLKRRLFAQ